MPCVEHQVRAVAQVGADGRVLGAYAVERRSDAGVDDCGTGLWHVLRLHCMLQLSSRHDERDLVGEHRGLLPCSDVMPLVLLFRQPFQNPGQH